MPELNNQDAGANDMLSKRLEQEPITLSHIDKLIQQIRENAVHSEHLEDHVQLTRILAERIMLEKPEQITFVQNKLRALNLFLSNGTLGKHDTTMQAANDDKYYAKQKKSA